MEKKHEQIIEVLDQVHSFNNSYEGKAGSGGKLVDRGVSIWRNIGINTLASAWFTYEPVSYALSLRGPDLRDEILTGSVALTVGVLTAAINSFSRACDEPLSYKQKKLVGAGSGAIAGGSATIGALGVLDLFASGGLLTAGYIIGGGFLGGIFGSKVSKLNAKKQCKKGHVGECCERICMKCGFIFFPIAEWDNVIELDDAKKKSGDKLTWYDVVSIFHYRDLNYVESTYIFEKNGMNWGCRPARKGLKPLIDRDDFFLWFQKNESYLSDNFDRKPSPEIWKHAEKVVRSDCNLEKPISITDIGSVRT